MLTRACPWRLRACALSRAPAAAARHPTPAAGAHLGKTIRCSRRWPPVGASSSRHSASGHSQNAQLAARFACPTGWVEVSYLHSSQGLTASQGQAFKRQTESQQCTVHCFQILEPHPTGREAAVCAGAAPHQQDVAVGPLGVCQPVQALLHRGVEVCAGRRRGRKGVGWDGAPLQSQGKAGGCSGWRAWQGSRSRQSWAQQEISNGCEDCHRSAEVSARRRLLT